MLTLHNEFKAKLQEITKLSNKVNKNHSRKLLDMMKDHTEEIEDRYQKKDDHWAVETADLIVLCFELLLSEHKDIDEIFEKCIPRFDTKLSQLANGESI